MKILNNYKSSCIIFVPKFFKYILFMKRIETVWSRDVIDIKLLAHFEFKIHKDFMY